MVTPSNRWLEQPDNDKYIAAAQELGYWLSKGLGNLMVTGRRIELRAADLTPGTRYVMAANHQCRIDPFVIGGQLPHPAWSRLRTFRYMMLNVFLHMPVLKYVTLGLGCFPAKPDPDHPYGLDYATAQLSLGRTLFIFPEGRRTLPGEYPARRGVAVLANEPQVQVIPVHIQWRRHGWWRTFRIAVGRPFDGHGLSAEELLERIYALPLD